MRFDNVLWSKAGAAKQGAILVPDLMRRRRQRPGEIQHGALPAVELGDAVVHDHHLAELGVAGELAYGLTMRHQAVVAAIGGGDDHRHHLAFELAQTGRRQHQLVVHGHEIAQLLRPKAVGLQHVRHEAQLIHAFGVGGLQVVVEGAGGGDGQRRDMVGLRHGSLLNRIARGGATGGRRAPKPSSPRPPGQRGCRRRGRVAPWC
jgi:hypothetical protein